MRLSIFQANRKGLCTFYSVHTSLKKKAKMGVASTSVWIHKTLPAGSRSVGGS